MSDDQRTRTHPAQAIAAGGWQRAPDYHSLFANQSRLRIGPGEFGLTFGQLDDVPGFGQFLCELVCITVTPTHAKRLAVILTEFVKAYEAHFGSIPPEPTTPIDIAKVSETIRQAMEAPEKSD
jgi:hypothetical protein